MAGQKIKVSYRYTNPSGAGPFKGSMMIDAANGPKRGDEIPAIMGRAIVTSVGRLKKLPKLEVDSDNIVVGGAGLSQFGF
jgi:hypothetical protein